MPQADAVVLERLRAAVADPARVSDRPLDLVALANDASHVHLVPEVLVRAADTDEVARLLRAASALGAPLTFRSGGTSLSGQASTSSVLVDTRRAFTGLEVLDAGARVRVQPGVTVRAVNAALARHGRRLGPDPASEVACTIGGVLANNSSGMACGTEQNSYRTVESMVLVLPSGTVIDTGVEDADERLRFLEPALHTGLLRLRDRVRADADSVARIRAQFAMKNTMGYGVNSFLDFDSAVEILAHVMVGSEGTLGFIAEATFRTVEIRPHVGTSLLVFDSVQAATAALPDLVAADAATLELMDATSLRVGGTDPVAPQVVRDLRVDDHAALLVEFHATGAEGLTEASHRFDSLVRRLPVLAPTPLSSDTRTRAQLWHLRKGLYAQVAGARPSGTTALLEDVVVPVERLSQTCVELTALFDKHGYSDNVIFGHAKDGNIHFMLTDRFSGPGLERYAAFTEDMVDVVLAAGGSLKAEHGTGRVMAPFVRRQYGDELYGVMWELKRLLDPAGVLNPGVVLDEDPQAHLRDLKEPARIEPEADRCVECGYCEPVCPSRDLTLTPRQRIVAERAMVAAEAAGDTELLERLRADYDYAGLQTCAVDGMCQTTCPVGINTGDLVKRLRAGSQTTADKVVWGAAARRWGALTSVAGLALGVAQKVPAAPVRAATTLGRSVLGSDRLPQWSPDLPGGGRRRSAVAMPTPVDTVSAVYLPACIGAMFGSPGGEPAVQEAVAELAARAGVRLVLPTGVDDLCCGTPWSSKGLQDSARSVKQRTRAALEKAVAQAAGPGGGPVPVVCDAASCTEGLVSAVDGPVRDVTEFAVDVLLPRLTVQRKVPRVVLHPTCSGTRSGATAALHALAAAVAEEVVVPEGWGCCAFAGDRGMLHPELTASATRREVEGLRRLDPVPGTVYASSSRTCEIGMSRATGEEYVHLVSVLAEVTRPAVRPERREP